MTTSVRLDDVFVEEAKIYAEAANRSVPKQIEYWAEIGKVVEDNPDLTYEFIKDTLLATSEINTGRLSKYVRRNKRGKKS